MSSELESTIVSVRKKVLQTRSLFTNGQGAESTVVDNIIRPILRSLGWNTGEDMILSEFDVRLRNKKGRADLILSKGPEDYILAVEAKKLGTKIDGSTKESLQYLEQLINYLISLNREFGILTNGEEWHLIRRDGFDWDTIWIKNILNDDLQELVRSLSYISPDNSEELSNRIELEKQKKEVLEKEWMKIIQDRDIQLKLFSDLLLEQIASKYNDISIDTIEIVEFLKVKYYGLSTSRDDDGLSRTPEGEGIQRSRSNDEVNFWLTPIGSSSQLQWLVGEDKVYVYGDNTPGREELKPGDWLCFYATDKKKGVVGHARVKTKPIKRPYEKIADPEKYPWTFELDTVKLYLDNPIRITEELRGKLKSFQGRDLKANWGWFVMFTKELSKDDFELLTNQ